MEVLEKSIVDDYGTIPTWWLPLRTSASGNSSNSPI
jgi:hypothetical protein